MSYAQPNNKTPQPYPYELTIENGYTLSLVVQTKGVEYSSPAFEMFAFGEEGDPFGGEYGGGTDGVEEVAGGDPDEEAELFEGEEVDFCKFVVDVGEGVEEGVGSVVGEYIMLVDVLPASPVIYQSNYVIENGFNFIQVLLLLPQQHDRPLHHSLRLLVAVEERKQLIHDV